MTTVLSVRPPSPALLLQPMRILPSGEKTLTARGKQHASYTPAIFWKGRAMVTSFLPEFAILSQGIRANLAQWLEHTANNRKVPGSNPGSAASPFLFTWGPSITICAGSVRCLAGAHGQRGARGSMKGSAGPALAGRRIVGAWRCALAVWGAWLVRRTVGEPGMPLHGKWLGPGALGRSGKRASFGHRSGHRSKTACCLLFLASPRILQGRSFMAQRITTPKTKQGATTNKAMGAVRLGGMTFWGIVLGGGPIVLHAFHIPVGLVVRFL